MYTIWNTKRKRRACREVWAKEQDAIDYVETELCPLYTLFPEGIDPGNASFYRSHIDMWKRERALAENLVILPCKIDYDV